MYNNWTMISRKIFNYPSKILIQETIDEFGYHPDDFGPFSAKLIICQCRFCGKAMKIRKGFFNKAGSACHKECKNKELKQQKSPFCDKKVREKAYKKRHLDKSDQEKEIIHQAISSSKKIKKNDVNKSEFSQVFRLKKSIDLPKKPIIIRKDCGEKEINEIKSHLGSLVVDSHSSLYDVFVPSKNFAIKFNLNHLVSEYQLSPLEARKKQYNSTIACRKLGIRLFHIFENNWELRSIQIMNFIKSIVGKSAERIMARKCSLDCSNATQFVEKNHIQGSLSYVKCFFNLNFRGHLVASMTASNHHRQNIEGNPVVLSRLCFLDGVTVQGGATRLFKQFKEWAKKQKYTHIVSWSDNSWTEGRIYDILGFELIRDYGPDYFYWDMANNCYVSKQSQRKSATGCPKEITERDWCYERGLRRIFDCGKKLWEVKL